jgi:hypothetical protein
MADQSGTALFEETLQAYERETGITLDQHPLTVQLQSCHSIGDVATLLEGRTQAFGDFRERDRMIKAIKTTVSILDLLSDAASLANAIGLVGQKALMTCSTSLTIFQTSFPPAKAIQAGLGILLDVWHSPVHM